eukprot:gnl/Dysnectes_brevis/4576_a6212_641.p1 GENE.gnl/Dysnectes_brevis/4576_a6212_641~~gnl/Dysnectes_brevis/4576_a6212_641.p1  ORF type:complete len:371 (-),score=109.16 gnl/Dysnectes_brevis/4576_a6212_641:38-1150(-)
MSRTPEILALRSVCEELRAGHDVIVATPVHAIGSFPTPLHARMVLTHTDKFVGTVGGGMVEKETQDECVRMRSSSETHKLFHFIMDATKATDAGMLCGGQVLIYLERITPSQLSFPETILSLQGAQAYEVILLEGPHAGQRLILDKAAIDAGESPLPIYNTIASEEVHRMIRSRYLPLTKPISLVSPDKHKQASEDDTTPIGGRFVIRKVGGVPTVHVFGGGHCGQALLPVLSIAGFATVLYEDREEWSHNTHGVSRVMNLEEDLDLSQMCVGGAQSYVVIMTRGHRCDLHVLRAVLSLSPLPRYIGMIGSRKKVAAIRNKLIEEGVDQRLLDSVHAPIGLKIGGDSPGQIAVSIAAQLIQVLTDCKKCY